MYCCEAIILFSCIVGLISYGLEVLLTFLWTETKKDFIIADLYFSNAEQV